VKSRESIFLLEFLKNERKEYVNNVVWGEGKKKNS